MKLYTAILSLLVGSTIFAQQIQDIQKHRTLFPDESAAILNEREHVRLFIENGELAAKVDVVSDMIFFDEDAAGLAKRYIYHSGFTEIENLKAETRIPGKNKFKAVPVQDINTVSSTSSGIFFGDSKETVLTFPSIQENAIARMSYTRVEKFPRFSYIFQFATGIPTINSEVSVSFPENIKIKYKLFGENQENILFSQSTKDGNTTYTWKAEKLDGLDYYPNAPKPIHYAPHVMIYADKYEAEGETITVLSDVDALYDFYYDLVKDINTEDDAELKKIVSNLVSSTDSKRAKIEKIYYWVQDNIKYVAFEDGLGGFVPREAGLVCDRKFGDCKDMGSILVEMLSYAGIEGHLTWIGTRNRPYRYVDSPTPHTDDHLIAHVELDGEDIFLDATGQYMELGYPTSMIQGKEALVAYGADEYRIVKVPEIPKEKNYEEDFTKIKLDGDLIKGTGQTKFKGALQTDRSFDIMTSAGEEDQLFRSMLSKGNNKFTLGEYNYSDLAKRYEPLTISYDFAIDDYAKIVGDEIYINLNLRKRFNNAKVDIDKRTLPVERDFKFTATDIVELAIPAGYKVQYLPENFKEESALAGCTITYKQVADKIEVKKVFYINHLLLETEKFENWNSFTAALSDAYQEVVVLEKK